MEGCINHLQKLWQFRATRAALLLIAAVLAIAIFQNSMISSYPLSLFRSLSISNSSSNPPPAVLGGSANDTAALGDDDTAKDPDLEEDQAIPNGEFEIDLGNGTVLKKDKDGHFIIVKEVGVKQSVPSNSSNEFTFPIKNFTNSTSNSDGSERASNDSVFKFHSPSLKSPPPVLDNVAARKKHSKHKKEAQILKTYYIPDMDQLLIKNRASPRSPRPRWPSTVDRQVLDVRAQIKNTPMGTDDPDLCAPVFRNISMFKRSYELMEHTLKVFVYKEGDRPIFHEPFFTGLYASEGWFMKQMEENRQFIVNDPGKAHMFYMPFSSRMLEVELYNKESHSKRKMIQHLKNYVTTISSKYPFWNRTGGEDHFLAGCHDWTTGETAVPMGASIRAVCTADVRAGFEIGKDVSLPETNVLYANDPHRDLGGKPSRKRTLLAFFAGQMHGYLRPILLQYWENKDPAMKIIGMMPNYGRTVVNEKSKKIRINMYIDYMKDSKYCICPRGYKVNSPRIVEAIMYDCPSDHL